MHDSPEKIINKIKINYPAPKILLDGGSCHVGVGAALSRHFLHLGASGGREPPTQLAQDPKIQVSWLFSIRMGKQSKNNKKQKPNAR